MPTNYASCWVSEVDPWFQKHLGFNEKLSRRKKVQPNQLKLTKCSNKLNDTDNVGGQVLIDIDVGGVEDGDRVEDDGVDAGPLLEDHGGQTQDEWMPNCLRFHFRTKREGYARRSN